MKAELYKDSTVDSFLGPFCSTVMQEVSRLVARVAPSELSILIMGESGSGKEWLSRRIHILSARSVGAFIPVSCSVLVAEHIERELFGTERSDHGGAEIVPGVFERAEGGTVFLDDIAHLPPSAQMKLAAMLGHRAVRRIGGSQDIPFNVRVIATIDNTLESALATGALRKDLFYRISPVMIEMPPLRARKNDIPLLIESLLAETNKRHGSAVGGMSPEALRLCMAYDWPGNILELRNALDYAALMARDHMIVPAFLPHYVSHPQQSAASPDAQPDMNVASAEKHLIEQALKESRTKKQAAKRLGISLKTLYNKMSRYDLYDKFVNYTRAKTGARTVLGPDGVASARLTPPIVLDPVDPVSLAGQKTREGEEV